MRIIIDIDEIRHEGRKTIRARTKWYANEDDDARVRNCGVEIYECIKEGFGNGFQGGIIIHQGEQQ